MAESPTDSLYESLLAGGGLPEMPAPRLRVSASVVPWRRRQDDGALEVFWVQRSPKLRFMGGWHAFPGGALDACDARTELGGAADLPAGGGDEEGPDDRPGLAACALRELFEETGVLPTAELGAGREPSEATRRGLGAARRRLLDDGGSLGEAIAGLGLTPRAAGLVFAGRWRTPPMTPVRFDNRFFLLEWPESEPLQPAIDRGELVAGEWITPGAALAAWRHGGVITSPPILHVLRVLAARGPEDGLADLRSAAGDRLGPFRRFEFRPGVISLPLATPTLPPAAHTNAFLVGHGECVLVDPGSPLAGEQQKLLAALADARRLGLEPRAVWLTHHHPDHVGAVGAVRRELGLPVLAHAAAARRLAAAGIEVDGELEPGAAVTLDGETPMTLRALDAPGHARGHLVFHDEDGDSLLAGDLFAGVGTVVIDPPDGEMRAYLESLRRVEALAPRVLFPAHGPPLFDGARRARRLIRHRLERERLVLAAARAGHATPEAMLPHVYPDLDPRAAPLARRQIVAHLEKLRAEGRLPEG